MAPEPYTSNDTDSEGSKPGDQKPEDFTARFGLTTAVRRVCRTFLLKQDHRIMTTCILLGLIAGGFYASQGAINARLAAHSGHVLSAAAISFIVGLAVLSTALVAIRPPVPALADLRAAPWWAYLGGVFGAFVVFASAFSVPKIGIAFWVAVFLAGILTTSVVLDHVGAFGQAVRPLNVVRVIGVGLLGFGAYLIQKY